MVTLHTAKSIFFRKLHRNITVRSKICNMIPKDNIQVCHSTKSRFHVLEAKILQKIEENLWRKKKQQKNKVFIKIGWVQPKIMASVTWLEGQSVFGHFNCPKLGFWAKKKKKNVLEKKCVSLSKNLTDLNLLWCNWVPILLCKEEKWGWERRWRRKF